MNSWIIVNLGNAVNTNLILVGPYASLDAAMAAIATTGQPYNYQPCQVWGPAVPMPSTPYGPVNVNEGDWIAVTAGNSENGGTRLFGYGNGFTEADAQKWARSQNNASGFSFGPVFAQA